MKFILFVVCGLFVLLFALAVLISFSKKKSDVEGVPLEGSNKHQQRHLPPSREKVEDSEIRDALRNGRKIEAVKMYREKYGVDLKTAKDSVEAMEEQMMSEE